MEPVVSSNIQAVGYDHDERTMHVQFSSGTVYEYLEVVAESHSNLMTADSIGKHFAAHIRPNFTGRKVR